MILLAMPWPKSFQLCWISFTSIACTAIFMRAKRDIYRKSAFIYTRRQSFKSLPLPPLGSSIFIYVQLERHVSLYLDSQPRWISVLIISDARAWSFFGCWQASSSYALLFDSCGDVEKGSVKMFFSLFKFPLLMLILFFKYNFSLKCQKILNWHQSSF